MPILPQTLPYKIDDLVDVLTKGEPILIFDSDKREGETDIFFLGKTVKDSSVRLLRKEGGGMVFSEGWTGFWSLNQKFPYVQNPFGLEYRGRTAKL